MPPTYRGTWKHLLVKKIQNTSLKYLITVNIFHSMRLIYLKYINVANTSNVYLFPIQNPNTRIILEIQKHLYWSVSVCICLPYTSWWFIFVYYGYIMHDIISTQFTLLWTLTIDKITSGKRRDFVAGVLNLALLLLLLLLLWKQEENISFHQPLLCLVYVALIFCVYVVLFVRLRYLHLISF